jgi:hypothetical protein
MLSVTYQPLLLCVIVLNVIMLSVIMLSVVAPKFIPMIIINIILGKYSQNFIFFIAYKCAQLARVLDPGKPIQPSVIKHSNLLGLFVSYEQSEML